MVYARARYRLLLLLLVTAASVCTADTIQDNRVIATYLFGIPANLIDSDGTGANYNYNNWKDSPGIHKNGKCDAYDGGHSGIDLQTKDVAGTKTANRKFFSLSKGVVIKAGGDKYNTIAIYDETLDVTSLYLHARNVDVAIGQTVEVGVKLGIQGSTGAYDAEHVHFEVRKGKNSSYACGAIDSDNLDPALYALNNIYGRPIPFMEDVGACPFEGCVYREWVAEQPIKIYSSRDENSPVLYTVSKGDRVKAVTGIVQTIPGIIKVIKSFKDSYQLKGEVMAGEILYLFTYLGEGCYKTWHQKKFIVMCPPTSDEGLKSLQQQESIWWVQIMKDGENGWTREGKYFSNKDLLG